MTIKKPLYIVQDVVGPIGGVYFMCSLSLKNLCFISITLFFTTFVFATSSQEEDKSSTPPKPSIKQPNTVFDSLSELNEFMPTIPPSPVTAIKEWVRYNDKEGQYLLLEDILPDESYVISMAPMNSSGDCYHILAYLILARSHKKRIPDILLTYDGEKELRTAVGTINTWTQVGRILHFVDSLGYGGHFKSPVHLTYPGQAHQNNRQNALNEYLKTSKYTEYIDQKALTSLISFYFYTHGIEETTKQLIEGFSVYDPNYLKEQIYKEIEEQVIKEINKIKLASQQQPLIIMHMRISPNANDNQNADEEIIKKLKDHLENQKYALWFIFADGITRNNKNHSFNKLEKDKKKCSKPFPYMTSDDVDNGKFFHLNLLLELKKLENLKGVIGNTSGTLDLTAFLGHKVYNCHEFEDTLNYQCVRILIQSEFLTVELLNTENLKNVLRKKDKSIEKFKESIITEHLPNLQQWISSPAGHLIKVKSSVYQTRFSPSHANYKELFSIKKLKCVSSPLLPCYSRHTSSSTISINELFPEEDGFTYLSRHSASQTLSEDHLDDQDDSSRLVSDAVLMEYEYTGQDIINTIDIQLDQSWERINIAPADISEAVKWTVFKKDKNIIFTPITGDYNTLPVNRLIDLWKNAKHIKDADNIVIPYNPGLHWVVLKANMSKREIIYVDSIDQNEKTQEFLKSSIGEFKEILSDTSSELLFETIFDTALIQPDNKACGVTVVENLMTFSQTQTFDKRNLTPSDIYQLRVNQRQLLQQAGRDLEMPNVFSDQENIPCNPLTRKLEHTFNQEYGSAEGLTDLTAGIFNDEHEIEQFNSALLNECKEGDDIDTCIRKGWERSKGIHVPMPLAEKMERLKTYVNMYYKSLRGSSSRDDSNVSISSSTTINDHSELDAKEN